MTAFPITGDKAMPTAILTRRLALLGAISSLGGCSALSALNSAAEPLDTYDLKPVAGSQTGARSSRTMLVARPEAPAAISSDRIMVKPDPVSITYLPDARWTDELPLVVQSLLIRSISGTGRIGYVGQSDGGPVPDSALLVRLDAFNVERQPGGALQVVIAMDLTVLNDRDQMVVANRNFGQSGPATDDSPVAVVAAFQSVLEVLLPAMADWAVERA
jgi:cholesterol transport system auxiliary component